MAPLEPYPQMVSKLAETYPAWTGEEDLLRTPPGQGGGGDLSLRLHGYRV